MAFVNSIKQSFLGGTSAGTTVSMLNTSVATGGVNINVNIPSPQYCYFGMLRVKSLTPATGATLQVTGIFASDGNTSNITQIHGGDSSAIAFPADRTYADLITDIKANQVIVRINASVAATVDIEFAAV